MGIEVSAALLQECDDSIGVSAALLPGCDGCNEASVCLDTNILLHIHRGGSPSICTLAFKFLQASVSSWARVGPCGGRDPALEVCSALVQDVVTIPPRTDYDLLVC